MKTELPAQSAFKKEELDYIVETIRREAKVEMIILFGSYARGDWVEDWYIDPEDHVRYEYKSDFDILVVVKSRSTAIARKMWDRIEKLFRRNPMIRTWVSLIVHDIRELNEALSNGEYFFTDIKKEGVLLYDSGKLQLAEERELNISERRKMAEEDFSYWFNSAQHFFSYFEFALSRSERSEAAFLLHQSTERYVITALMVFTHYKPKTHDLEKLFPLLYELDPRFVPIFPRTTEYDKRCFDLLRRAYIEARYRKAYTITKEELEYCSGTVQKLKRITKEVCNEKISHMSQ